ncbi:MAG: peptidase S41, partial [Leptolyngbyaceae cyanobacterium SL_1_1]|nr:peptidase S41 [Leptolyngbyaceae cyanobacterium SL_1_1]
DAQREQLSATPTLIGTPSDPQYSAAISALRPDILANRANPQATRPLDPEMQQSLR